MWHKSYAAKGMSHHRFQDIFQCWSDKEAGDFNYVNIRKMSKSNWKLDPLLSESDRSGLVLPIAGQDIQWFQELAAAASPKRKPLNAGGR